MGSIHILWVDDEIDFLQPHLLFLKQKNYKVSSCVSGSEALELVENSTFDIVFLDENMPGLSGLETLSELKAKKPNLPVVMITKSEEEQIMEDAIGNKIADYLIKPVNPNQILLTLKKNLDHNRLVSEKTSSNYLQEFRKIALELHDVNSHDDWMALYAKLVYWEIELESIEDHTLFDVLETQKNEANAQFGKFISSQYESWFSSNEGPLLSHQIFKKAVVPELSKDIPTIFIVIDNLRLDQWKAMEGLVNNYYKAVKDTMYFSILPTATQYARNAIFSGLTPLEMSKIHPNFWKNDTDEGGKNLYEKEFLEAQLKRLKLEDYKTEYHKITNLRAGKKLVDNFRSLNNNDLTVIVYNFVDMLSHAKTEMEVLKELAANDKAYRSLTLSWFKNSPLLEMIQKSQDLGFKLIITTDHGTINANNPSKVIGTKETSINLRYKTGRSLSYNEKDVLAIKNPNKVGLPSIGMSSTFIFAKENLFFAYPNNFNYYVNYYRNTYQHGGISMEEVMIPFIVLNPR